MNTSKIQKKTHNPYSCAYPHPPEKASDCSLCRIINQRARVILNPNPIRVPPGSGRTHLSTSQAERSIDLISDQRACLCGLCQAFSQKARLILNPAQANIPSIPKANHLSTSRSERSIDLRLGQNEVRKEQKTPPKITNPQLSAIKKPSSKKATSGEMDAILAIYELPEAPQEILRGCLIEETGNDSHYLAVYNWEGKKQAPPQGFFWMVRRHFFGTAEALKEIDERRWQVFLVNKTTNKPEFLLPKIKKSS